MIPTYKDKGSIESDELRQLLLQTNTWIVEDDLSTKSTI